MAGAACYYNESTRPTTWTESSNGDGFNMSSTTRADLDTINPMVGMQASRTIARLTTRVAEAETQIREVRSDAARARERATKAEQKLEEMGLRLAGLQQAFQQYR